MHHSKGQNLIFCPYIVYNSNAIVGRVMSVLSLHIESPSYSKKKTSKSFYSRTKNSMILKIGMQHFRLKLYEVLNMTLG